MVGTCSVRLLENAPVVPVWKRIAPPPAADVAVIPMLTVGVETPDGLVTRIRHGEGAHMTNRAAGLALLLICSSTSMSCLLGWQW